MRKNVKLTLIIRLDRKHFYNSSVFSISKDCKEIDSVFKSKKKKYNLEFSIYGLAIRVNNYVPVAIRGEITSLVP